MRREQALPYVGHCVDDALAPRACADMPANARLIGWQCGFEPMFVAVWSYLGRDLGAEAAAEIATDYLAEMNWFADGPVEPDYVI